MTQTTLRDYLQTTEDAINSGRVDEALVNCQHILTHFPDLLEAQRLLGEIYLKQGHLTEARQTFDWILTNDPENVVAYCSRALISERLTDYDTALDCYQQAYELSRGNGHIRQEFNQLSEKVGQPSFIFSRAGLARLYMRGDLLPQAIQEWEAVLTATPDRLDAQVGLLETLWREGFYDRVEQLANQILQEVPDCLKALLLLAHVTLPQNAQQAQELMQRARALDCDLVMAQELFNDYVVSNPKDPFVLLLKNSPTIFPDASNGKHAEATPASAGATTANGTNGTQNGSAFSDPLVRWSSLDDIMEPQQDYQPAQEASPFGNWASSGITPSDFESWNTPGQQSQHSAQPSAAQDASSISDPGAFDSWRASAQQEPQPKQSASSQTSEQESDTPTLDAWNTSNPNTNVLGQHEESAVPGQPQQDEQTSSDAAPAQEQTVSEQQQPWYHVEIVGEAPTESWSNANTLDTDPTPAPWQVEEQENALPAPPAWLDMLTRSERRQSSGGLPQQSTTKPLAETEALTSSMKPADQQKAEPVAANQASSIEKTTPAQSAQHDEEPFFFGPEWLKSLGATTMDSPTAESPSAEDVLTSPPPPTSQQQAEVSPPAVHELAAAPAQTSAPEFTQGEPMAASESASTLEPPAVPESWAAAPSTAPAAKQKSPVTSWLDQAAQKLAQPEQNLLTTLEELENDLRSKGFTPLEPGVLSTLAQETSLSSALAQLSNYKQQPTSTLEAEATSTPAQSTQPEPLPTSIQSAQPEPVSTYAQPAQPPLTPIIPSTEPWTTPAAETPLQPVGTTSQEQVPVASTSTPSHLEALANFIPKPAQKPTNESLPEAPRMDTLSQLVPHTAASTSFSAPAAPTPPPVSPPTPAARPAFALDAELETTMKRPSVRLQPMQQRPARQQNRPPAKDRPGERPAANKATDGNMSYKERLLKGYQYQLAGSYDDAMQEYRVVIRNAPDLLEEVVSNMRALLKLAPKYSAGYRVLGDAYMRQGEYLQAMEAYNKALTIAKKTKS